MRPIVLATYCKAISRQRLPAVYISVVQKILFLAVLTILAFFQGGCASHPKSSAHIYEGDAPNIRYAPSTAGGPQSVY